QTLEIRVRQLNPDIVLLDLASSPDTAADLIRFVTSLKPPVHVVGLHRTKDSDAILKSLRAGASEFLYAPFDLAIQQEAITRLRRLVKPEVSAPAESGNVAVFSSAKPGSGASTLATQTAFALKRLTGKRILLADFDLMGGTIGFYLKVSHSYSLIDALQHAEHLDTALWSSLAVHCGGVDILPAPGAPYAEPVDGSRLSLVLNYAQRFYDWVIVDLPAIFYRMSLMTISESDRVFLVSTSELPSLHLARKAINLLGQLGFPKERFQIVVNRVNKRDGIGAADMEKLFNCPVHASLPNDYFSLHRVVTLGQPLTGDGDLEKAIENLAGRLSGSPGALRQIQPALSQT
ncbi:MAG: hypothetical protein ABI165_16760, partial [Bryobacteraceae bacterium]